MRTLVEKGKNPNCLYRVSRRYEDESFRGSIDLQIGTCICKVMIEENKSLSWAGEIFKSPIDLWTCKKMEQLIKEESCMETGEALAAFTKKESLSNVGQWINEHKENWKAQSVWKKGAIEEISKKNESPKKADLREKKEVETEMRFGDKVKVDLEIGIMKETVCWNYGDIAILRGATDNTSVENLEKILLEPSKYLSELSSLVQNDPSAIVIGSNEKLGKLKEEAKEKGIKIVTFDEMTKAELDYFNVPHGSVNLTV